MELAIIGVGKMGEAFLRGIIESNLLLGEQIAIITSSEEKSLRLAEQYSVNILSESTIKHAKRILICVQPGAFASICPWISHPHAGYISIMAGIKLNKLADCLGSRRIVRAMPNLAATIHKSATALTSLPEAIEEKDFEFASDLFSAVGDVYDLPEKLFDTFTGMVGSGPAYAAIFAEALADGGVRMGLNRKLAIELAGKLLISTGELLLKRVHPSILKDEVASPGGTTIAGIAEIERYTFRAAIIEAVKAASLRGLELGQVSASED